MKHLKLYNNEPEVGDYVLMKSTNPNKELASLINNTIGKLTQIRASSVIIRYNFSDFICKKFEISSVTREFNKDQIVIFGKTEEEIKRKKKYKNFNL